MSWQSGLITALDIAARLLRVVALLAWSADRTGAILVGLFVVFAGVAERPAGLTAMHRLLDGVIENLVIIIVVVFQADIRRALACRQVAAVGAYLSIT